MAPPDVGLFGPDSVTWRLHSDPSMLVGGLRALLVQALEPRAMAGVDQHSDYRTDPWGRLRRTVEYVVTITYSDTATAEQAAAGVRRVHERVQGVDPHTGRPYDATDPGLLLWVHAALVHSVVLAYRRYGGPLSDADADRYVREQVRAAELIGIPVELVPHDLDELCRYVRAVEGLQVTPEAKRGARMILAPPMPLVARPLWAIPAAAAVTLLPRAVRQQYGLPWFPPADAAVRMSVFGLLRALNIVLPASPARREAEARARGEGAVA